MGTLASSDLLRDVTTEKLRAEAASEDARLRLDIRRVHEANEGVYGSPRITLELHKERIPCGRHRVARLMRSERLAGRVAAGLRDRQIRLASAAQKLARHSPQAEFARTQEKLKNLGLSLSAALAGHEPFSAAEALRRLGDDGDTAMQMHHKDDTP